MASRLMATLRDVLNIPVLLAAARKSLRSGIVAGLLIWVLFQLIVLVVPRMITQYEAMPFLLLAGFCAIVEMAWSKYWTRAFWILLAFVIGISGYLTGADPWWSGIVFCLALFGLSWPAAALANMPILDD